MGKSKNTKKQKEKAQNTTSLRSRNMMYEQQLKHLNFNTVEGLIEHIKNKLKPKKYAAIVHNKDIDKNGNPVTEHVHVFLQFEYPRYLSSIAKQLNDKPQYIEKWDGKEENGFSYLIHATKKAQTKHQYSPDEVKANFDYPTYILAVSKGVKQTADYSGGNRIRDVLNQLYAGVINKEKAISMLTGSQYANAKRKIEDICTRLLVQEAEKWRKKMQEENKQITVVWCYGHAGTGKSSYAREYAKSLNQEFYIAGSTRDMFQAYKGQHTIILDELRPRNINYPDLLRVLDPYGITSGLVYAPSRFTDKALAADTIIITSPYNPYKFYENCVPEPDRKDDSFEQLLRRITLIQCFTDDNIYLMEFESLKNAFKRDTSHIKANPYSAKNRKTATSDKGKLFDAVTSFIPDTGIAATPDNDYDYNVCRNGIPINLDEDSPKKSNTQDTALADDINTDVNTETKTEDNNETEN